MMGNSERTALGKYLYGNGENLGRIKKVATYYNPDGNDITIKVTAERENGEPMFEVFFPEYDYEDMLDGKSIFQYMGTELYHFIFMNK